MAKKKTGRKNKRKRANSGKHADVSDVIEAVHAASEMAAQGGPIEAQDDDDLFFTDTKPTAKLMTRAERKAAARAKVLHIDAKLSSKAVAIGASSLYTGRVSENQRKKAAAAAKARLRDSEAIAQRRAAKNAEARRQRAMDLLRKGEKPRSLAELANAKKLERQKRRAVIVDLNEDASSQQVEIVDAWAEPVGREKILAEENVDDYVADTIMPVKRRKLLSGHKMVANVRVAAPGQSYNPVTSEHTKHLVDAAAGQIKRNKAKAKLDSELPAKSVRAVTDVVSSLLPLDMMMDSDDDGASDSESLDEEAKAEIAIARKMREMQANRKPRTARQRRNITISKVKNEEARRRKLERRKRNELYLLKRLNKEVLAEIEIRRAKASARAAAAAAAPAAPITKLGKGSITIEPEFLLPSEIPSSLRRLPIQGSVLADRMTSIYERGKAELPKAKRGKPSRPWLKTKVRIHKRDEWAEHPLNNDDDLEDSSSGDEDLGRDDPNANHNATRIPGYGPNQRSSSSRGSRNNHNRNKKR
ncbi:uncharacterized protein AMSG_04816 [Thecamonas trahens ATCC 50062]|uniref:Ribosome biogenesis protein NOP53 n=1 Tax=Thecamonas trahens ATCC 50062 TaxID=461836 RepID=A0A0L0D7K5_THETB|nr:hypothetical protein AMSG_04816 [Thecamonas trahens ATCC 50062]KNC48367.1 hypothetical protein AMSG_04816 [Thecamonas trahens ATCC 50062]|eukprot:XP_013758487.1 hypothetical protein AMSG_04816 [Thecamonas trahens ATCC 50062]